MPWWLGPAQFRMLANLANAQDPLPGSALLATSQQSNHAGQVRGHRCHRQGAHAQQYESHSLGIAAAPARRALAAGREIEPSLRAASIRSIQPLPTATIWRAF